ncbi:PHB de-polymerase domain-containing protein [Caballeronia peredens]|nr:PHB de-polymerase domain-containing protein [Caballeronia peredens]
MTYASQLARSQQIAGKVTQVFQKRAALAQAQFSERARDAGMRLHDNKRADYFENTNANTHAGASSQWDGFAYATDLMQRSILFWDTLRKRGNQFVEQTKRGLEPVLHFDHETIVDGRTFARPVNYALLRIVPPDGVEIDARKRPYLIIDPRAGHGPGIGGFKDDSQVGVALRAGHPVYFVTFFRDPQPGQTLLDVCAAEQQFVKHVRELHPDSAKPAIVGNCQGGWAAMMLASSQPDDTGPLVINGAPMSYWSGAWSEGEGDNPMRYSGGMLGGTWLASFTADLGHGKFDGAHLVQNFENLNPANSFWDKYYNLFDNVDTEPARFLDFERWWGGYYLMNREEIEWITRNLFVGNALWSGDVRGVSGASFDLRAIKTPIILFASMGDNITPPQQAFNWVADIYGTTDEIKAHGQVIVGLMHENIGHLGIFVSGKVAKKEYTQIASVLEAIESFPPGLYGMEIAEHVGDDGKTEYDVSFREHRLEDVVARFNRFERVDEGPFEAVKQISDFNQRAYEMFAQPFVQAMSNDATATMLRAFHPLRAQRWMFSDLNPWLAWLGPAADAVKAARKPVAQDNALRVAEHCGSDMLSASLDFYRAMRDAATESLFFSVYGNLFSQDRDGRRETQEHETASADPRTLPFVQDALASIAQGGYAEAVARIACLLMRHDEPLPLARMILRQELTADYAEYLPQMPRDAWRRMRGEQEIIVRYEPEQALSSLSVLLDDADDRKKLLTLIDKLLTDSRVQGVEPTDAQRDMLARIRAVLPVKAARAPRRSTLAH